MLYLPVAWHEFSVYDDGDYIWQNHVVQAGLKWDGVKWAFGSWHSSNWHPLTWLSHMLDCQVFGLNAGAHHLVNVALHVANTLLLFLLLFRLTKALWPAGIVAALFAWHPLHVESVAWVAERKDVLSTFFGLLALLAYVRYVQEKDRRSFWVAVGLFACSLMAKPMLVTLPCVFLLLDWWPLGRVPGVMCQASGDKGQVPGAKSQASTGVMGLVVEKWPFFLLTVGSSVVTYFAQRGNSVIPLVEFPLASRLGNAVLSYGRYLLKMIWPQDLAIVYPLPRQIPWSWVAVVAVLLAGVTICAWVGRRRAPYLLMGWLWFLGTLVPVIGLVQVGTSAMADRYSYIPLVGIFIALVFGLRDLAAQLRMTKAAGALAGVALAGCLGLTTHQLTFWQNDEALFGHAVAVTHNNAIARINYGNALANAGQEEEAQAQYHAALENDPRYGQPVSNVGICEPLVDIGIYLDQHGKTDEAMEYYNRALQVWPAAPVAHMNLGGLLAKLGRFDEAMQHFEAAEKSDPADSRPHYLMGKARLREGRDAEAVTNFYDALKLNPMDAQSWLWLARVRAADEDAGMRNGAEAVDAAGRANRLTGENDPAVLDVLAMAYAEAGRFAAAIQAEEAAIQIAEAANISEAVVTMREHLQLYQGQKAYRENFKQP